MVALTTAFRIYSCGRAGVILRTISHASDTFP
jgi:hypothetical protein